MVIVVAFTEVIRSDTATHDFDSSSRTRQPWQRHLVVRLGFRPLLRRSWTRAVSGCRAKNRFKGRSYEILGAAEWKMLKYVSFSFIHFGFHF